MRIQLTIKKKAPEGGKLHTVPALVYEQDIMRPSYGKNFSPPVDEQKALEAVRSVAIN